MTIIQDEKEMFDYLNELRERAVTNMFGAAPYLVSEFGIAPAEARRVLSKWMKHFDPEGYENLVG